MEEGFAYLQSGTGIVNNMDGETHRVGPEDAVIQEPPVVATQVGYVPEASPERDSMLALLEEQMRRYHWEDMSARAHAPGNAQLQVDRESVQGPYLGAEAMDTAPDILPAGETVSGREVFLQGVARMREDMTRLQIEAQLESTPPLSPAEAPVVGDLSQAVRVATRSGESYLYPSSEGASPPWALLGQVPGDSFRAERLRRWEALYQSNLANVPTEDEQIRIIDEFELEDDGLPPMVPVDSSSTGLLGVTPHQSESRLRTGRVPRSVEGPPIRAENHISPDEVQSVDRSTMEVNIGAIEFGQRASLIRRSTNTSREEVDFQLPSHLRGRGYTPTPVSLVNIERDAPPPAEPALCCICLFNAPNIVLRPCGHACLCTGCSVTLIAGKEIYTVQCPLCKALIGETIDFLL